MRTVSLSLASTLAAAVVALVAVAVPAARAFAAGSDEEAVRAAVGHYLKGQATGDPEEFRKAFHPEAKLFWVKDGQLAQRTSAEFIAGASGKPADDEAQRKRRVVLVDVADDVAVVKIELDYPKVFFTDYLSLHKVGGEWRIVNKSFTRRDKK